MQFQQKVYAELLRSGMCNRLFIWANAIVYSHQHNIPYAINGWYKTQIGPWLRNERTKRFYALYFRSKTDLIGYAIRKILAPRGMYFNPPLTQELDKRTYPTIIFNTLPHFSGYFDQLHGYNGLIQDELTKIITPGIQKRLLGHARPDIGVHIRRGDFFHNPLLEGLQFFKDAIHFARDKYGSELKVTIFSDGYESELKELLQISGVSLFRAPTDIEELIVLSRSKVIVTSLGSTYSYWAAFLSNATIVHSSAYNATPVRWQKIQRESGFGIETNTDSIVVAESLT